MVQDALKDLKDGDTSKIKELTALLEANVVEI